MKKTHFFSSNLFKNEDFFKISKTNDYFNYLEKLVEQHFSKTLFDASESAKNTFFVTSIEAYTQKKFRGSEWDSTVMTQIVNFRYLVNTFQKNGHPLHDKLEKLNGHSPQKYLISFHGWIFSLKSTRRDMSLE
jgi:hypothetical protein